MIHPRLLRYGHLIGLIDTPPLCLHKRHPGGRLGLMELVYIAENVLRIVGVSGHGASVIAGVNNRNFWRCA